MLGLLPTFLISVANHGAAIVHIIAPLFSSKSTHLYYAIYIHLANVCLCSTPASGPESVRLYCDFGVSCCQCLTDIFVLWENPSSVCVFLLKHLTLWGIL